MLVSLPAVDPGVILVAVLATVVGALGVGLSWQRPGRALQASWMVQAVGLAAFAVAWIASVM
jgi:hypothetical protein